MIHRLAFLLLPLLMAFPTAAQAQVEGPDPVTMPLMELEEMLPEAHPSAYFIYAMRRFEAGDRDEGVRWFYIGQLRWRFHIGANPGLPPDGDPALLASMMEVIGRPINEWAGGDVDGWIGAMQAALDWDAANPNGFTDKKANAAAYETTRAGLAELIASIDAQRDEIPGERERNGLENR